jgi:3-hydroxybutyryl-CoA dehydrogenase
MAAIARVLVVGYGAMGRGIAQSFAAAGFATTVLSRRPQAAAEVPSGVTVVGALPQAAPDLIIESVPEDVDIKRACFAGLEAAYGGRTIIATNSSGIPLPELERGLQHPERFLGTHYFYPAESAAAVEIMAGTRTAPDLLESVAEAVAKTGKEIFLLRRPVTGYLINRLQHALLHETYHLLASGVASADELDRAARLVIGPRLCIGGLLEQKDIGGLAIHAGAQRSIVPALDHSDRPNPYLQEMVARGETGLPAGRGFYDWHGTDSGAVTADAKARLGKLLGFLRALGPRAPNVSPRPRKN